MKNKSLEIFAIISLVVLVCSLLYLVEVERSENIAKTKEINSLKTQVNDLKSKNFEKTMIIEGYENKLSKFHISNLEQVGLGNARDKNS